MSDFETEVEILSILRSTLHNNINQNDGRVTNLRCLASPVTIHLYGIKCML